VTWLEAWSEAAGAFGALAAARGEIERIPDGGRGPDGEELSVDVALLGPPDAERCVIVSSGLHGVEGVAGSAIQRRWLERGPPAGARVVLLHVLNPFGFAWQRRVDGANVDLNRNFLLSGERYEGAPPAWPDVSPWLNPARRASRWDPLLPRLLLAAARHGRDCVQQAIAGGQYTTPRGLFFGGAGPRPLHRLLGEGLPRWARGAREVMHVDIHTGLGRSGELQVLLPHAAGTPIADALVGRFGSDARPALPQARHYRTTGSLGAWAERVVPGAEYTLCAAEFGTVSPQEVVAALHQENRAFHWGRRESRSSGWARDRLSAAFAPRDPGWRRRVLDRGVRLIDEAVAA
jgi:hypothetical protein